MQTDYNTYEGLRAILEKETPILIAQIRALYRELDKKFHLQGAKGPITFGFETDSLGSRMDLYKHEYAHYMRYNMPVPKQYQWQPGIHGSAWKYCCSLVGAAPTPYYKAGEALMNHNYEKTLRNPIHDKTVVIRDQHRREQEYRRTQNVIIKYETGESVDHPKFGEGIIEKIEQQPGSVTLHIRFGEDLKVIDQKWLIQTKYKKGKIQRD